MSGLSIKKSITRAQGRHLHDIWLKNIWQLERGQKLLKCQEKPYSVHKMQENAWRLGLRPGPRWGAYSASPDPLAGGEGAGYLLLKNPSPALGSSGLGLRPFGRRLSSPPNFRTPKLKSWLRPCISLFSPQ